MKTKNAENLENATPPIRSTFASPTSTLLFAVVFTALAALAFTVALAALASQAEAKLACGAACPTECTARGLACFSKNVTEQVAGSKLVCRRQINTGCGLYLAWPVVQCNPGVPGYVQDPEIDGQCDCGPLGLYALFGGGANLFHKDITTECRRDASCRPLKRVGDAINCTLSETVERKCCDIPEIKAGKGEPCIALEDCEAGLECRNGLCTKPEVVCPGDQELYAGECVPKCSEGQERVAGECVPICGAGFVRVGKTCQQVKGPELEGLDLQPQGTAEKPVKGYLVGQPVLVAAYPRPATVSLEDYALQWEVATTVGGAAGNVTVKDASSAELVATKEGLIGVKATAGNASGETWFFFDLLPLARLEISPSDPVVPEGRVFAFVATGITTEGEAIPAAANWSATPVGAASASINSLTGEFKAIRKGQVLVKATARGGNNTFVSANTTVNITESDVADLEIIPGVRTLYAGGDCVTYAAVANNTKGESMSAEEIPTIKWSLLVAAGNPATLTEFPGIANKAKALVCPLAEGEATIVASVEAKPAVAASLPVKIMKAPETREWRSLAIKLPPGAAAPGVEAGKPIEVYAEALDQNGAEHPIQNIQWKIDPEANGSVAPDETDKRFATVTGLKLGVIQVNVSAENATGAKKNASSPAKIIQSKLASIKISPSSDEIAKAYKILKLGQQIPLTVKGYGAVGEPVEVFGEVVWQSSNAQIGFPALAKTSSPPHHNNFVVGLQAGDVKVTASFAGPPALSDEVSIKVLPPEIESVEVLPKQAELPVGYTWLFRGFAWKPCSACTGGRRVVTGINFDWTSSNTDVVHLDERGGAPSYAEATKFFAKAFGEATVYANITAIPLWGNATVKVIPAGECTGGLSLIPPREKGGPLPPFPKSLFETYISVGGECKIASFWECLPGTVVNETIAFDTAANCPTTTCTPTNVDRLIYKLTPEEKNVTIGGWDGIAISTTTTPYSYLVLVKRKEDTWASAFAPEGILIQVGQTVPIGFGVNVTAHAPVLTTAPYKANLTIHYVC